jgi:YbbR domain-containing protein
VDVKLERVKEKSVPIRAVLSGTPAEGCRIGAVQISPSKVVVEGAESELKDINEVVTEEVEVEGVKESFTLMVPLNYYGKYTSLKEQKTAEVRVTIDMLPQADAEQKIGSGNK